MSFDVYLDDVKGLLHGNDMNSVFDIENFVSINPVNDNLMLKEGQKKLSLFSTYERNPKARKICLDYYGPICQICKFDAEKVYGLEFKGKIQVHHRVSLNEIGKNYIVDPIKDLIPVCPNCHMIIHSRKDGYYTIEEVVKMIKKS